MENSLFYAKILLFGEYAIIENGRCLTLPYNFYEGSIQFSKKEDIFVIQSKNTLNNLFNYLKKIKFPKKFFMDFHRFKKDLNSNMYFNSNIPQGYGIGSSGALIAALFDRYLMNNSNLKKNIKNKNLIELKNLFSKMESYFHGKSSGIDPLICFMNIPLLIESNKKISTIKIEENLSGKSAVFLIDSGIISQTKKMIKIFFDKIKNEKFRILLKEEFIMYNNACIQNFIQQDLYEFFKNLKNLSKWVFEHLHPMIPKSLINLWIQGIETDAYYLKLCGSGGGGFLLGFASDYSLAKKMLKGFNREIVYRF